VTHEDTLPTPPMRPPKAILFDWDNTLADNWGCIREALNTTLTAHGHQPWTVEEAKARIRQSLRDSFPKLFGDAWPAARDLFYARYAETHRDHVIALPGAADLLAALAESSVYLGIVSNKTGTFLRAEAEVLGWTDYFGQLVGAADAASDKPDPAPVMMALEPSSLALDRCTPEDVWFVGDAGIDMECAHRAGCLPVLVGAGTDAELVRFPPAHHVADCSALADLVRRAGVPISLRHLKESA